MTRQQWADGVGEGVDRLHRLGDRVRDLARIVTGLISRDERRDRAMSSTRPLPCPSQEAVPQPARPARR